MERFRGLPFVDRAALNLSLNLDAGSAFGFAAKLSAISMSSMDLIMTCSDATAEGTSETVMLD